MPVTGDDPYVWLKDQGEDVPLLLAIQSSAIHLKPSAIAVAVSGGSDSMALLHLAARTTPHVGWRLEAVTVDHHLRPEAAAEAEMVTRACAAIGVPHDVLVWDHGDIKGNLMDQARRARYGLIAAWARARGIGHVALGHTADDQAETFLMGLARSAGLDGLSGMRLSFDQDGVTFFRPFRYHTRADLRAFLERHRLGWIDDPTNDNDRFTRTKARRALKALKPLGITVDRLSSVVHNLRMSRSVVSHAVAQAAADTIAEVAGSLCFDLKSYTRLGPELDRLILQAMIRWMTGLPHPQRADSIRNLRFAFIEGRDATLAGCRFRHVGGKITMTREPRATGGPASVGTLWDHRWIVEGPPGEVRALGPKGLPQVKDWRALGIPREVLLVTPAVWHGDTLLAAPVAGMENGWKARIVTPFHRFPVSD